MLLVKQNEGVVNFPAADRAAVLCSGKLALIPSCVFGRTRGAAPAACPVPTVPHTGDGQVWSGSTQQVILPSTASLCGFSIRKAPHFRKWLKIFDMRVSVP